jgi:hypothetical protein
MSIFNRGSESEKITQTPSHPAPKGNPTKEQTGVHRPPEPKTSDTSFFGGKKEITRGELRGHLRGSEGWKAQRSYGLNLSREERARLEKDVFPSSKYGSGISRDDWKRGLKKLKESSGADKSPEAKKEAKFLKKLGGIR